MSKKKLKKGFTTGAAAAAAVKAALISIFKDPPKNVEILFLTGEKKQIPVFSVKKISSQRAEAVIIKDAGDDPDVTHKAKIGAKVTVSDAETPKMIIRGGKGVGVVTKPGLELAVGEPAINPGPRTMIKNSVKDVFDALQPGAKQVEIEIFVPEGERLAQKTLNARLGILGGISILGTTGIVTPMSHDAYIATIKSGISVAAAGGADTLVFTTGRRSERYAMDLFEGFKEDVFIQTGDFFKASLDMALLQEQINRIIYTVFFGKAVKMALGFAHTHAAKSELTLEKLSQWTHAITGNETLAAQIRSANTAREAFSYLNPDFPQVISHVGKNIIESAKKFSRNKLEIRAVIFDFEGRVVFNSQR